MRVSGWCSAPTGARPMCGGCRVLDCEHECHQNRVVERDSAVLANAAASNIDYDGVNAKRPLGGVSAPLIQGASPTNKESTDA